MKMLPVNVKGIACIPEGLNGIVTQPFPYVKKQTKIWYVAPVPQFSSAGSTAGLNKNLLVLK